MPSAANRARGAAVRASGSCLCGGVRYEVRGPLRDVIACHCSQCRKTSGHFVAASQALSADLVLIASATLEWYRSSAAAERGFCSRCGGNLFWRPSGRVPAVTSIMAGTLDPPTGLRIVEHLFVEDKSDYY
ncbi:MAG TPA: GFA family protein [Steroidobacteraceae bacterium]|nr:GFA family protein [Steroidobacteraceae bacterium]